MRTHFPLSFYSLRPLYICTSLLLCPLFRGPFLPKFSADGSEIWGTFIIRFLTANVVSIHLGERLLPFTFFFFFLPAACLLRELGEVVILMEGDYFDGIPACVIY